jgi:hypothetical protein
MWSLYKGYSVSVQVVPTLILPEGESPEPCVWSDRSTGLDLEGW